MDNSFLQETISTLFVQVDEARIYEMMEADALPSQSQADLKARYKATLKNLNKAIKKLHKIKKFLQTCSSPHSVIILNKAVGHIDTLRRLKDMQRNAKSLYGF